MTELELYHLFRMIKERIILVILGIIMLRFVPEKGWFVLSDMIYDAPLKEDDILLS